MRKIGLVFILVSGLASVTYADSCDTARAAVENLFERCADQQSIACKDPETDQQVGTVNFVVFASRINSPPQMLYTCYETTCDGMTPHRFFASAAIPDSFCGPNLAASGPNNSPNSPRQCGSIVEVENRVLIETIPIVGANFGLTYSSRFVQGRTRDYKIKVPVTITAPKPVVTGYKVEVRSPAGTLLHTQSFTSTPGQEYSFQWNGLNDSLQSTWGPQKFSVTVYEYATDFNSQVPQEVITGSFKAKNLGLGGWVPSNWKYYSHLAGILFEGDGGFRKVVAVDDGIYKRVASEDASLVHYFDSEGRLVFTKSGLIGTTIETFSYDGSGRLSTITESFGRITTFNRDSSGNFVSVTAPNGKTSSVTLDTDGWLESLTNPKLESYQFTYSGSDGLLATFTKPNAAVSTFTYNSEGELISDVHSGGSSLNLASISGGVSSTSSMGRVSQFTHNDTVHTLVRPDSTTSIRTVSDSQDRILDRGYDNYKAYSSDLRFGAQSKRLIYVAESGLSSRIFDITKSVTLSDSSNPYSILTYDSLVRKNSWSPGFSRNYSGATKTFTSTTPLGKVSTEEIDLYERPVLVQYADRSPIAFTYTNDRLTSVSQGGRNSSFGYDPVTKLLVSHTNPLSQSTLYSYDSAERLIGITTPDLRVTGIGYDSVGNIVSVTPPSKPIHSFTFNGAEMLGNYNPPALAPSGVFSTTYSYNLDRELTSVVKPSGQSISYTYSGTTGRLQKITSPSGDYIYTYESGTSARLYSILAPSAYKSMLVWASGVVSSQYLFDPSNRQIFSLSRESNSAANGKVTAETLGYYSSPYSRVEFGYDNDEFLISAGNLSITRDSLNGDVVGTGLGVVATSQSQNSFGETISQEAVLTSGGTLFSEQFTRDALGRISTNTVSFSGAPSTVFEYIYDLAGRLIETRENTVVKSTYVYDDNGNRTAGLIAGVSTSASYNDQDQLTAYNTYNYTYDEDGNLASKTNTLTSETWTYTYDVFGNLIQVTTPTSTIAYQIDAYNRRVSKSVNGAVERYFMYDLSNRLIAELDSSTIPVPIRRYVYASQSHSPDFYIEGGVNYRIIKDHIGSPRVVVNASTGAIVQQMNHDEFGRVVLDTSPKATAIGFAGGLYDPDTGLVRFGARDYDPYVGRWTSKDPILFEGKDTNLYGYVFQNPINFVDPSGKALSDVDFTNVVGGAFLFGGGVLLIGGSTSLGPVGILGVGVGAGAILSGGGLLINELNNLKGGPFPGPTDSTSKGQKCEAP